MFFINNKPVVYHVVAMMMKLVVSWVVLFVLRELRFDLAELQHLLFVSFLEDQDPFAKWHQVVNYGGFLLSFSFIRLSYEDFKEISRHRDLRHLSFVQFLCNTLIVLSFGTALFEGPLSCSVATFLNVFCILIGFILLSVDIYRLVRSSELSPAISIGTTTIPEGVSLKCRVMEEHQDEEKDSLLPLYVEP